MCQQVGCGVKAVGGQFLVGRGLSDGLRAMRARGELPDRIDPDRIDPDRFALALLAAVQGGLLLTQARRDTLALEASRNTLIDCLRGHADG
ncbi:hypothetical protein ACFY5F_27465 [Streptomyces sp. NPDC013161]|uniref:hypothetical protein n=1 Tax=Streptomyces sp. NPDC013161 TaxID=3364862 RepID=UPI0036BB69AD